MTDKNGIDENSFLDDLIEDGSPFDDHIEENPPVDSPIKKDSSFHDPIKKKPFFQKKYIEKGGHKLLFFVTCLFLAGLAAPLVLIYLFKSPQPEQHLFIFGVSYYKLLFVFFLVAALIAYASVFFLKANPLTILLVFLLSLFCCFPLVVGLRNNLTLTQAIIEIPFFASWPFFLNPAYILIEFLIPAGIVIYLLLQIKSLFSRKQHTYAFFCAASYLGIAAFLGFTALTQAGQPNMVDLFRRGQGNTEQLFPGKDEAPDRTGFPVLQAANDSSQPRVNQDLKPLSVSAEEDLTDGVEFNRELKRVSEKLDRILVALARRKTVPPMSHQNPAKTTAVPEQSQNTDARQDLNPTAGLQIDRTPEESLSRELQQISVKLARIADKLSGTEPLLSKPLELSLKTPDAAEKPQDTGLHPEETADDRPEAEKIATEEISRRLQQLSAKVEQIWKIMTPEEILPKEAGEAENQ